MLALPSCARLVCFQSDDLKQKIIFEAQLDLSPKEIVVESPKYKGHIGPHKQTCKTLIRYHIFAPHFYIQPKPQKKRRAWGAAAAAATTIQQWVCLHFITNGVYIDI